MKNRLIVTVLLVLASAVFTACVYLRPPGVPAGIWTPAPVTAEAARPTSGAPILPVATPTPHLPPTQSVTPTRPAGATPTPQPTASAPAASATPDPHLVTITEADVVRAVASGTTAQGGLTQEGLGVQFTDGKLRLTAKRLSYGPLNVQDLVLVGRLAAQDGRLQLQTESIAPGGLLTALIPSFANQALAQYAAQWYVEEVRTLDGRLELRIR